MRHNVEDLKGRALVESNILKQFILSATAKKRGEFKPQLDDILIHDYQMANSVTLNVILSNYMVDLAYAIDSIENPLYGGNKDSYFKLVRDLDETNNHLDDQTRLVLDVADGDGTFKSRDLILQMKEVWNQTLKVKKFFNLDSIWYCQRDGNAGNDRIDIVNEMNDFVRDANPFGDNPFDKPLFGDDGTSLGYTFNKWLTELNCIIENRFYKNVLKDDGAKGTHTNFGDMISKCRYLLCGHGGFYGLEAYWDTTGGERAFKGFKLHDIGATLPILGKSLEYKFCSFHVIGNADETTLFLAVKEKSGGLYHYLYLNESSIDETYGFTEIDSVVVDQLIVQPSEVFSWVDSVRELDTVNIALTDYGFWDIEANQTNNITYSYRNGKSYENNVTPAFNGDNTKLIDPTISIKPTTKYCEYSHEEESGDEETYRIDRLWNKKDGYWYACQELDKPYRSSIVGNNGNTLNLVGCTEHFAVYDSNGNDPIHILVNLSEEQFKNLLFSDAQLTNYFIEWLYDEVIHPLRDVPNGDTREEWYLYNNYSAFIANLGSSLAPSDANEISYSDLHFQLRKEYSSSDTTIKIDLSDKFGLVVGPDDSHHGVVDMYDASASTLTQYCTALNDIVNALYGDMVDGSGNPTGNLNVNWLIDSGESSLI